MKPFCQNQTVKYEFSNTHRILPYRCTCGNCGTALLENAYECYCCCELEGCEKALNNEEVKQDLEAEGIQLQDVKCVTQHPGFNPICLQKWSPKMQIDIKLKIKANMCNRQHLEGKTAEFVFIFVTNL